MKTTLKITGMDCPSCKTLIEDTCKDIPGVKTCDVSFETGIAKVEYDAPATPAQIMKEITDLEEFTVEEIV